MNIFNTINKLLSFRLSQEEMLNFNKKHLIAALLGTWIVGIGRYWDDKNASLFLHLGLGSVIYIFVLALLIWAILLPYKLKNWSYFTVLVFIGLTSFPAILYAIPVEQFVNIETANKINVWFLAIVALWRLLLLFYFLKVVTKLNSLNIFIVTLLPITLIITALTVLNLHKVVFNIMGGVRNQTAHDASYGVLIILTTLSVILVLPLLIGYLIGISNSRKKSKNSEIKV